MIIINTGLSYSAYINENLEGLLLTIEISKVEDSAIYNNKYMYIVNVLKIHSDNQALLLIALKNILQDIRQTYGVTGIDNIACNLDTKGIDLLSRAINKAYIYKNRLTDQTQIDAEPDLNKKEVRTVLVDSNAKAVQGLHCGYYLDNCNIVVRENRSFAQERVTQLLSHICTQLYNFCFVNKTKSTEFQALYINNKMFITANENCAVEYLITSLKGEMNLQEILTNQYTLRNKKDRDISRRRANKINQRVYKDKFHCEDSRYSNIVELLNKEEIYHVEIKDINNFNNLDDLEPGIYFVQNINEEHAEICLTRILKIFTKVDKEVPIIYGKKRPCFTCHTQLTHTEKYVPFEHGTRPGFLFKETFYKQPLELAQITAKAMSECTAMYKSDKVDGGYATLSDSDCNDIDSEIEDILIKSTNKLKIV